MAFFNNYFSFFSSSLAELCRWYVRYLRWNYCHEKPEFWVDDKNKIIYIVLSKCACTSIKTALLLYAEGNLASQLLDNQQVHGKSFSKSFKRRDLPENLDDFFIFTFVRNPIERVRSTFQNKFLDLDKVSKYKFEYSSYLGGIFNINTTWTDFQKWVSLIPDRLADRHFISQTFWLNKCIGIDKIDFIGKVENIESDWKHLQDKFDFPSLTRSNASGGNCKELVISKELVEKFEKDFMELGYEQMTPK